jgi:hypothetical protein
MADYEKVRGLGQVVTRDGKRFIATSWIQCPESGQLRPCCGKGEHPTFGRFVLMPLPDGMGAEDLGRRFDGALIE